MSSGDSFLHVSSHPVVRHKVTQLRRKDISQRTFKQLLSELTFYLGYEATANLETKDHKVETPIATHVGEKISSRVALVPVMRAGLGMVDAMQDLIPKTRVYHLGMFRNKAPCFRCCTLISCPLIRRVTRALSLNR